MLKSGNTVSAKRELLFGRLRRPVALAESDSDRLISSRTFLGTALSDQSLPSVRFQTDARPRRLRVATLRSGPLLPSYLPMPGSKPWTEEEIERLRKLRAAGATSARISIAVRKSQNVVRAKARELGIPFAHHRDLKRQRIQKERAARVEAGLPADPSIVYGRRV